MSAPDHTDGGELARAARGALAYVLFVPAALVFLLVSATLYFFVIMLLGASGAIWTAISVAWLGGSLVLLFLGFQWLYRRITGRGLGDVPADSFDVVQPPARTAAPMPAPTLAELDARLAQSALPRASSDPPVALPQLAHGAPAMTDGPTSRDEGRAASLPPSSQETPASNAAAEDSSPLTGLLRGAAWVAGFGLGIGLVFVDGVLVGDGPLWLAEVPLILGAVAAVAIAARGRSRPIVSAAEGFFGACALFALLLLGAG